MSLRFLIPFVSATLFASGLFAQDKSQPTVDELVAKNIEAKGGATALNNLRTLRSTGKLLVPVQGRNATAARDENLHRMPISESPIRNRWTRGRSAPG